jgi:hypothetical protein
MITAEEREELLEKLSELEDYRVYILKGRDATGDVIKFGISIEPKSRARAFSRATGADFNVVATSRYMTENNARFVENCIKHKYGQQTIQYSSEKLPFSNDLLKELIFTVESA